MKKKVVIIAILTIILGVLIAVNFNTNKVKNDEETNVVSNEILNKNNITENTAIENIIEENVVESNVIENQDEISNINNKVEENVSYNNKTNENTKSTNATIKMTLSPSGFMGSSLKKVVLYSNGEVYIINYNGEGYEEKNIVSRELIAKNAENLIYKGQEEFEAIIIKGKKVQKVNTNYSWIEFQE